MAVDLEAERDLGLIEVVDSDVGPGEAAQLRDPSARQRGQCEQRPIRLRGGRQGLLDLLGREDRQPLGEGYLWPFGREHQRGRDGAAEPEPPGGELVDPTRGAEHGVDRRLALAGLAQVSDHLRQLVGGDAVQPAVAEAGAQVLLRGAAVAGLCRRTQVEHRAGQPQVGRVAESEPGVR
ncbi:MAG TPA: hypothetical protein VHX66_05180 [Solirubrobacteraceae bacterium]|nr:hypothetical protein [Solirubrobacteraceae bacterium]